MKLQALKRRDVPLHAELASVLRNRILGGELRNGDRLPPIRELSEELGVARMTIVQAMDTLVAEGLIERQVGRGTFVKDVELRHRHRLKMRADMSELHSLVLQLEVSVLEGEKRIETDPIEKREFLCMGRIHTKDQKPFCHVTIRLANELYQQEPKRFSSEIVVRVLEDLGIELSRAKQFVRISHADFDMAQALGIKVNSAVFDVSRQFFDHEGSLIYSASLIYPGDLLEFEIDFSNGTK